MHLPLDRCGAGLFSRFVSFQYHHETVNICALDQQYSHTRDMRGVQDQRAQHVVNRFRDSRRFIESVSVLSCLRVVQ